MEVSVESKSNLIYYNKEEDMSTFGKICQTSPNKSASKRKQSNFTEGDQENMDPNRSFNF